MQVQGHNHSPNTTNSKWEDYVDKVMDKATEQAKAFENYVKEHAEFISHINRVAKFAVALLVSTSAPTVIGIAGAMGFIARAFSPEQVKKCEESFSKILQNMPTNIKAIGIAGSIFSPTLQIVFFAVVGVVVGIEVGSWVSPHTVAKALDKIIEGKKEEDKTKQEEDKTKQEEEKPKAAIKT